MYRSANAERTPSRERWRKVIRRVDRGRKLEAPPREKKVAPRKSEMLQAVEVVRGCDLVDGDFICMLDEGVELEGGVLVTLPPAS